MTAFPISGRYLPLCSGLLTLYFDCLTGGLRNIELDGKCVWRELVVLVRDRHWQTIPVELQILETVIAPDNFRLHIIGTHLFNDLEFRWNGEIIGDPTGKICYAFVGEALAQFESNRIGFCLLHPCSEYAGQPIRQTRSDGRVVTGRFPSVIEPQIDGQFSMTNLSGLAHQVQANVWAEAEFTGEIFETEDQRNWTDASFKTYCPPLERPIPLRFQRGDTRQQSVVLQLKHASIEGSRSVYEHGVYARPKATDFPAGDFVQVRQTAEAHRQPVPEFGLCLAACNQPPPDSVSQLFNQLGANYLRWDLVVPLGQFASSVPALRLATACMCALAANCKVELAIHIPCKGIYDAAGLAVELRKWRTQLKRILLYRQSQFVTSEADINQLRGKISNLGVPIGGGSDANFCELNRELALRRFPLAKVDFLCWSINPQVHTNDDLSLMETVQALSALVETARQHAGGLPLVVSPITLLPRFNAVASETQNTYTSCPPSDLRQRLQIGAAWSMATWHALSTAGIQGTTWFEAFGPRGFADEMSLLAAVGVERKIELDAIGLCFRELLQSRPQTIERAESSTNLSAVLLHEASCSYLSVVNLSAQHTSMTLDWKKNHPAEVGDLPRVSLAPYEVRLIELTAFGGK